MSSRKPTVGLEPTVFGYQFTKLVQSPLCHVGLGENVPSARGEALGPTVVGPGLPERVPYEVGDEGRWSSG